MEQSTEIVPVQITKDKVVQVQVTIPEGEPDVGIREDILATFGELTGAIEEISRATSP